MAPASPASRSRRAAEEAARGAELVEAAARRIVANARDGGAPGGAREAAEGLLTAALDARAKLGAWRGTLRSGATPASVREGDY